MSEAGSDRWDIVRPYAKEYFRFWPDGEDYAWAKSVWPVLDDAGFASDISEEADAWTRSKIAALAILYLESATRLKVAPEPLDTGLMEPMSLLMTFGSQGNLDAAIWEVGRVLIEGLSPKSEPPEELLMPLLRSMVTGCGAYRDGPRLEAYLSRVRETYFDICDYREDELRIFWVGSFFSYGDLRCSVGPLKV